MARSLGGPICGYRCCVIGVFHRFKVIDNLDMKLHGVKSTIWRDPEIAIIPSFKALEPRGNATRNTLILMCYSKGGITAIVCPNAQKFNQP